MARTKTEYFFENILPIIVIGLVILGFGSCGVSLIAISTVKCDYMEEPTKEDLRYCALAEWPSRCLETLGYKQECK